MSTAGLQCFDESGVLTFDSIDGLARVLRTGYTNGIPTSEVYIPEWEWSANHRPWFTTLIYGFAYQSPVPSFSIDQPYLRWYTDPRYAQYGTPNIRYIVGIW